MLNSAMRTCKKTTICVGLTSAVAGTAAVAAVMTFVCSNTVPDAPCSIYTIPSAIEGISFLTYYALANPIGHNVMEAVMWGGATVAAAKIVYTGSNLLWDMVSAPKAPAANEELSRN